MTKRIKKSAAEIDWSKSAVHTHNHIRAFSPKIGAYTDWDGKRLKILRAKMLDNRCASADKPGTVFAWEKTPAVVTGDGCLSLVQVQMAGKRPMAAQVFLRGRKDFVGTVLGSCQPGE